MALLHYCIFIAFKFSRITPVLKITVAYNSSMCIMKHLCSTLLPFLYEDQFLVCRAILSVQTTNQEAPLCLT